MKSVIVKGFSMAIAVFLTVTTDGGTACTLEPMGGDEYGLSVADDKAAKLAAACQSKMLAPYVVFYHSDEYGDTRIGVFTDIQQAEAFLVECVQWAIRENPQTLADVRALQEAGYSFDAMIYQGRIGGEFQFCAATNLLS